MMVDGRVLLKGLVNFLPEASNLEIAWVRSTTGVLMEMLLNFSI